MNGETTYQDVAAHFIERSHSARSFLEAWRQQPDKAAVVPFVEAAVTRTVYALAPADVEDACRRTEHALGDIRKETAGAVDAIVDWHPAFAFQHVLHYVLEATGGIPTYQDVRAFCRNDSQARAMLAEPAVERVRLAENLGATRQDARDAMRWRVGNAYLSFLRELYVLTLLREEGLNARYHVLADVLLRVDFWADDLCFSLFVRSPRFMTAAGGRKIPAPSVLADGPFRFAQLELPIRHEYGRVHLPDRAEVLRAAQDAA
jgi:hypothetical protein